MESAIVKHNYNHLTSGDSHSQPTKRKKQIVPQVLKNQITMENRPERTVGCKQASFNFDNHTAKTKKYTNLSAETNMNLFGHTINSNHTNLDYDQ